MGAASIQRPSCGNAVATPMGPQGGPSRWLTTRCALRAQRSCVVRSAPCPVVEDDTSGFDSLTRGSNTRAYYQRRSPRSVSRPLRERKAAEESGAGSDPSRRPLSLRPRPRTPSNEDRKRWLCSNGRADLAAPRTALWGCRLSRVVGPLALIRRRATARDVQLIVCRGCDPRTTFLRSLRSSAVGPTRSSGCRRRADRPNEPAVNPARSPGGRPPRFRNPRCRPG